MATPDHLVVFSPHHDDAYWKAGGISLYLKQLGWKVTFITVIGEHYRWGGGRAVYQARAAEAAQLFGVNHIQLDYKSMDVQGPDTRMAEEFCELMAELKPTIAITEYPKAIHPDHQGVAINSLRALTKDWYGAPRELPAEVWCYYGYTEYPLHDILIDNTPWVPEIERSLMYWHEFGPTKESHVLYQSKLREGFQDRFFLAKADPVRVSRVFDLLPGKVRFNEFRLTSNILF